MESHTAQGLSLIIDPVYSTQTVSQSYFWQEGKAESPVS